MNLASQAVRNTRLPLECHMPDRKQKYYRDRLLSYLFPGFISLLSGQSRCVLVLYCLLQCGRWMTTYYSALGFSCAQRYFLVSPHRSLETLELWAKARNISQAQKWDWKIHLEVQTQYTYTALWPGNNVKVGHDNAFTLLVYCNTCAWKLWCD